MLIPFHRLPRLGLIVIALFIASVAHACSGGGYGYGGYGVAPQPQQDPTYTPSATAFATDAPNPADHSVLVALERRHQPIGIWDDALVSLSKVLPFVRYQDDEAAAFAQRWGIPSLPAIALCDRLGNVIAAIDGRISANAVHGLVDRIAAEKAALDQGLDALYQRAADAARARRMSAALTDLDGIARFTGLPACAKAASLRASLIQDGESAIASAVTHDRSEARTELGEVARVWRGTAVGDAARKALRELE